MRRRAYTLLEVLLACGVLLFGLLGIAGLITFAGQIVAKTQQRERGTDCASAAIADLFVRGWLDQDRWLDNDGDEKTPIGSNVILDPDGIVNGGLPGVIAGVPRVAVDGILPPDYTSTDDLQCDYSKERPEAYGHRGEYTWFASVCEGEVTAIACRKRTFDERVIDATVEWSYPGGVLLQLPPETILEQDKYVMLVWDDPGGLGRHFGWWQTITDPLDGQVDLRGGDFPIAVSSCQLIDFDGVVGLSRKWTP